MKRILLVVRYVESNPVRAKPMLELFPDWAGYLAERGQDDAECIRIHSRTGRPLGNETFIRTAESQTGRILAPQKPGRKPRRNPTSVKTE